MSAFSSRRLSPDADSTTGRGLEDKAKCVLCSDDPAVYVEELDGVQFDVVMVVRRSRYSRELSR